MYFILLLYHLLDVFFPLYNNYIYMGCWVAREKTLEARQFSRAEFMGVVFLFP